MLATTQSLPAAVVQGLQPWPHGMQSRFRYQESGLPMFWHPQLHWAFLTAHDHAGCDTADLVSAQPKQWARSDLVHALQDGQFVSYFQPKVDFATGAACQAETLVRWEHPELGVLAPNEFIEQMEHQGLIGQLTEALLRKLLVQIQSAAGLGTDIGYAINVSAATLENPSSCMRLRSIVREHGVSAERITIELTETAAVHDFEALLASLTRFRDEGFEISADDFGKGYSTLEQIHRIPFTEIKIDQMFVASLIGNERSMAILESIVHLAGILGLHTVAEGIETREQLVLVKSTGCDAGQGYYFARPMSYADLLNYLGNSRHAVAQ